MSVYKIIADGVDVLVTSNSQVAIARCCTLQSVGATNISLYKNGELCYNSNNTFNFTLQIYAIDPNIGGYFLDHVEIFDEMDMSLHDLIAHRPCKSIDIVHYSGSLSILQFMDSSIIRPNVPNWKKEGF